MGKETSDKHYPVADLGLRTFYYTDAEKKNAQERAQAPGTPFFTEEEKMNTCRESKTVKEETIG